MGMEDADFRAFEFGNMKSRSQACVRVDNRLVSLGHPEMAQVDPKGYGGQPLINLFVQHEEQEGYQRSVEVSMSLDVAEALAHRLLWLVKLERSSQS